MKKDIYEKLKERFGDVASWALYQAPDISSKDKHSNVGDMSIFQEDKLLDKLHANIVMIALNASVHPARPDGYTGPWQMFHSAYHKGFDYRIRESVKDTPLEGCYMTDMIKNYPEAKSKAVKDKMKDEPEWLQGNLSVLREELDMLEAKPTLIALGGSVYDALSDAGFGQDYKLVKLHHYSYIIKGGDSNYYQYVQKVLKENSII